MSAAGFERVNVTHTKLFSVRAVKSLSSTSTMSGKALIGSAGANDAQNRSASPAASTASTPGKQTRGARQPSGKRNPGGSSVGNVRRGSPTAAITTFEPSFKPPPE